MRIESAIVQQGVSLTLEAHRRGLLDDRALALILTYYDEEGARDPASVDEVLTRLGGLSDEQIASLRRPAPALARPVPTAASSEVVGQRFNDRLTLLELIGEGGMGSVHRAYDRALQRVVAVKRIRTDRINASDRPRILARFEREAQAMARVRHPACVAIHDAGLVDGEPYLVMDFVPGRSLAAAIAEGPLEPRQVAEWGRALAEALQACHDVGVIHRDVKPANVLIDPQGKAHLTDFGVALDAKAHTKLTVDRGAVGTLCYMPPEQVLGSGTDARSDVYALGATLFEALAGRPPFDAELAVMVLRQVVDEEPPRLRALRRDVPEDLETVVHACLAKAREERFATAQALALDLARFLADEPVVVRAPTGARRLLRRLWRARRAIVVALGVGATLGLGLSIRFVHQRRTERSQVDAAIRSSQTSIDLDGAESALQSVLAVNDPELRLQVLEALRSVRGRRSLLDAEASFARAMVQDRQAAEQEARATALSDALDLSQPYAQSPEKQALGELETTARALRRASQDALAEARRLMGQAEVDGAPVASLRGRLLAWEGRELEAFDPVAADERFDAAMRVDATLVDELAMAALQVKAPSQATFELSRYMQDPTLGRMTARPIRRGALPATFTLGSGPHLLEVTSPGCLPWRSPLALRRGERRELVATPLPAARLGPLAGAVVLVPAGLARRGRDLRRSQMVDEFLLLTRELRLEEWWSFVLATDRPQTFTPIGAVDLRGALGHPARMRTSASGVLRAEVQEYLEWWTEELRLAGIPYTPRLPSSWEFHRALRGELSWVFPWGDRSEASFCLNAHTFRGVLTDDGRFDGSDRSPFGVLQLTGGVAEMTRDAGLPPQTCGGNVASHVSKLAPCATYAFSVDPEAEFAWLGFRYALTPAELPPQRRDPRVVEQRVREGTALEPTDLAAAQRAYTAALEDDRTIAAVWVRRGSVRLRRDDPWGAMWDFSVAIQLEPDRASHHVNRGLAQSQRGALTEAAADFGRALELEPRSVRAWSGRAQTREELGELAGAVADYEQTLALARPDDPQRHMIQARLDALRARLAAQERR